MGCSQTVGIHYYSNSCKFSETILPFIFAVPSRSGKKRNLSTQESSDSSTNKRPKGISSQEQHEDIFQTKEDDRHCSSDRKKAGQLKQLRKKEENFTRQTGTCNLIEEDTTEKSRGKQKSPLKCMPEATPENPQALTGNSNDKNVPKKLKLDLMERVEEQCPAGKEAREMSSESESSDDEGVAWEDVDGMYSHFLIIKFEVRTQCSR